MNLAELRRVAEAGGDLICGYVPAADFLSNERVLALLDAAALLEKTIYKVEGYTGPDVWWAEEARGIFARLEALDD